MREKILLVWCLVITTALSVRAETIVALTSENRLLFFDSATPGAITRAITVSSGESLVGLDFRPATGELFAIGASGRLFSVNLATGSTMTPLAPPTALNGTRFGFDFNPTVDRIRVTSDSDQNIRLNPDTGALAALDQNLQFAATDVHAGANPNVVGSAYTNNFVGAAATVLYDIDSNFDALLIQNPPNAGTLNTVGVLGVDTSDAVGFDISGVTGTAYASLTVEGAPGLYTINLASGAATLIGLIAPAGGLGAMSVLDISTVTPSRLLNISTRGRVGQANDVLIGGFITRGAASMTAVIRGIGPSLSGGGISSPLPDPVLTLYDSNGIAITTNDDWQTSPQAAQITMLGLAPSSPLESAILISLSPGAYTAIVAGKGAATGIALVEIYQLP